MIANAYVEQFKKHYPQMFGQLQSPAVSYMIHEALTGAKFPGSSVFAMFSASMDMGKVMEANPHMPRFYTYRPKGLSVVISALIGNGTHIPPLSVSFPYAMLVQLKLHLTAELWVSKLLNSSGSEATAKKLDMVKRVVAGEVSADLETFYFQRNIDPVEYNLLSEHLETTGGHVNV